MNGRKTSQSVSRSIFSGSSGTPTRLDDVIAHWARVRPDAPALLDGERGDLSYARLARIIEINTRALVEAGFRPGHRIAILHPGGSTAAVCYLSVIAHAVALPLNPEQTGEELKHQLERRKADGAIIAADCDPALRACAERLGLPILEVDGGSKLSERAVRLRPASDNAPRPVPRDRRLQHGHVLATSGTTDSVKVVPFSTEVILRQADAVVRQFGLAPDDRLLSANKPFLGSGVTHLTAVVASGGSMVLRPTQDVDGLIASISDDKPTWLQGSFTVLTQLLARVISGEMRVPEHRLRMIRASSGAIDGAVADGLERVFGAPVLEAYSSTETGRIAGQKPPPATRQRGTAGPLFDDVELRIADLEGRTVVTGTIGEITVRSPRVVEGYEDDPAANRAAFRDGWFRTGDLGYLDPNGNLVVTGRIKEMINRGGEKISPSEVEQALLLHPAVREAGAFAISHPTLGEIVGAAIVVDGSHTPCARDLTSFVKERLSPIKVPSKLVFVEALPRGPNGKLLRHRLAEACGAPLRS